MPNLQHRPLAFPTDSQLVLVAPDWCSRLPVTARDPTFTQRLLVDRYVIAPSASLLLASIGRGGRNVTGKGRHFN